MEDSFFGRLHALIPRGGWTKDCVTLPENVFVGSYCTTMSMHGQASCSVYLAIDVHSSLLQKNGCQRIKILGDCYYCIAGLDDNKTHAQSAVEMGRDMITHIA